MINRMNMREKLKRFITSIFFIGFEIASLLFSFGAIILVLVMVKYDSIPDICKIMVYIFTFYSMVVFIISFVTKGLPELYKVGIKLPIVGSIIANIRYRQRFFLYIGGIGNTLFLIFYFIIAFYYRSKWFYVIGLYNLCIAILRGYLSRKEHILNVFIKEDEKDVYESNLTKKAAFMLFIMNTVAIIMGLRVVFKDDTFKYNFVILYGLALYVFVRLTVIVVAMLQQRPHNSGIWKVVQLTNLSIAMISLFTFQTALLHNYETSIAIREHYNAMTFGLVFLINQSIVLWLFYYSRKIVGEETVLENEIKNLKLRIIRIIGKGRSKRKKITKGFKWVYIIGIIVVTGSVMGFGVVSATVLKIDREESISMLAMVPFMSFVYYIAMKPVVKSMSKKMVKLTNAMDDLANGNLDCRIEIEKNDEFQEVYKQFNIMALELQKTKQQMTDFTNEFAHEFKTPITAISGFSDYLLETADGIESQERIEQLSIISEESKRLLNLSMNTLLLSKVDAMQVIENKKNYDLAEQIRKCVILLSKSLDKKEIELDMDEDIILPYYGNEELLQHVWINLLNNAIKFTPKNGTIRISGTSQENMLEVVISDTGIGMDEKTKTKIFDKYYQNDTSSVAKGSGIGLSIVKRIVTLCGGTIKVESAINEGATFIINLPVKKEKE